MVIFSYLRRNLLDVAHIFLIIMMVSNYVQKEYNLKKDLYPNVTFENSPHEVKLEFI